MRYFTIEVCGRHDDGSYAVKQTTYDGQSEVLSRHRTEREAEDEARRLGEFLSELYKLVRVVRR